MMNQNKKSMSKKIVIGMLIFAAMIALSFANIMRIKAASSGSVSSSCLTESGSNGEYIEGKDGEEGLGNLGEKLFNDDYSYDNMKNKYYYAHCSNGRSELTHMQYCADYIFCSEQSSYLSEDESTDGQRYYLRPVAVIDIEGSNVTYSGISDGSVETADCENAAYQVAYSATVSSNEAGNRVGSGHMEAYMNYWGGWLNLLNKISDTNLTTSSNLATTLGFIVGQDNKFGNLRDDGNYREYTGGPLKSVGSSYACDVTQPEEEKPLSVDESSIGVGDSEQDKSKDIKKYTVSETIDGKTYKTKIGKYSLNNVTDSTTATIITTSKEYTGKVVKSGNDYYIYAEDSITEEITKIKLTKSYTTYKARILLLKTSMSQNRAVFYGKQDTVNDDVYLKIPEATDISVQKYITKVTESDNAVTYNNAETRKNKYADTDENLKGYDGKGNKTHNHQGVNISGNDCNETNNVSGDTTYKKSNPVEIEIGDTVEYTITVYNNSTSDAQVKVKDQISNLGEITGITSSGVTAGVEKESENSLVYIITVNGSDTFTLGAKQTRTFTVTIKYNTYTDNILQNKVWIASDNNSEFRTIDADYVKMKKTNVSLQKYITQVNGNSLSDDDTSLTDRKNKRSTASSKDVTSEMADPSYKNTTSTDTYKDGSNSVDNRVGIEVGDTVTYMIEVYNNSDVKATNVEVSDRIYIDEGATTLVEGTDYELVSVSASDGFNMTTSSKEASGTTWHTFTIDELDDYETCYITLKIKYLKYINCDNNQIVNIAKITDTTPPNDTIYRTRDKDYVVMRKYSVSLEKYVSKVEGGHNKDNSYDNRGGYRYNKNATTQRTEGDVDTINYSPYKSKNKVEVEAGDKVTFTIILKNTSSKTNVKISQIYDEFTNTSNYKLEKIDSVTDSNGNSIGTWADTETTADETGHKKYLITFNNPTTLKPGESMEVLLTFNVTVEYNNTATENVLDNRAYIQQIINRNGYVFNEDSGDTKISDVDSDTTDNNADQDWLLTKTYEVSLQKIVYSVNSQTTVQSTYGNDGVLKDSATEQRWDSWESTANINNSPSTEVSNRSNRYEKHNNPVTVAQGDTVRYAIKVRNDNNYYIRISSIVDKLPSGVEFKGVYNEAGSACSYTQNGTNITITEEASLPAWKSKIYYIDVKVTESNMSTNLLKNYAYIESLINRNNVSVKDTTEANNNDSDYIQLKDIEIKGTVWNDKALDKTQSSYNGVYDEGQEYKLSGIKVMLYRKGIADPIAEDTTDDNGDYSFSRYDINSDVVTEQCERYIKASFECTDTNYAASKSHSANYWKENSYYSYYVVFEYDGITYTSTLFNDVTSDNSLDSNAKEDGEHVAKTRTDFNNKFSTINNESGITYTTKNEDGYIPQSNHVYDSETMAMQSSTNLISLSNTASLESQLQHVNLGLRGRDVFDLELTSDVAKVDVTVNGQTGTYNYTNKVTVRRSDLSSNYSYKEDAANTYNEGYEYVGEEYNQNIRNTDKSYLDSIEVTYKITVKNASQTNGTATKIVNYYDSSYSFKGAYTSANKEGELSTTEGNSGEGYKSAIVTTPGTTLKQSETMDIYLVYKLTNTSMTTLKDLAEDGPMATYNMAEIYEYTTSCADGQTEYTRGLLDNDSAPGSANSEQVRTTDTQGQSTATTGGNPTTVEYSFNKTELSKLKYEDDTYATPTLYFVSDNSVRSLTGTVFEDNTKTDESTRVKTGNGIQDEGEVGVYGATVILTVYKGDTTDVAETYAVDGTDEKGKYTITSYIPGNATLTYKYGDTEKTVLLNQSGEVNAKSYNGEDYQATNNTGTSENPLSTRENYWYLDNEGKGVSTGTDNADRRKQVSDNVADFSDTEMQELNTVRGGGSFNENSELINKTNMYATTPNLVLSVEKSKVENDTVIQNTTFETYSVTNMNFGIAEVPVTTIDLQKHVSSFTITDSAGENTIAKVTRQDDGTWKVETGDVYALDELLDVSIEDEKLQGARLEVTYGVTSDISIEKNFDGTSSVKATINGLADFIDNDLSYNTDLGENGSYWNVMSREELIKYINEKAKYINSEGKEISPERVTTVDKEGTNYTTIVNANATALEKINNGENVTITLEKTLSSQDITIGNIITSSIDTYEYENTVEITGISYSNYDETGESKYTYRDRVRTPKTDDIKTSSMIILAGAQYDSATSETITVHPPTGSDNSMIYYVIALISLGVLAIGTFGIKKFVVNKK